MEKTELESDTIVTTPFMTTSSDGYAVTDDGQAQGEYVLGAVATQTIKTDESEDSTETVEARLTVLASGTIIDPSITDPVSYTHLDVYKRQTLRNGRYA